MLTHLHIRHFAIIDNTELELQPGMTALTGETGAGKSILLDALGLVLGDRANSDSVQQGAERAEVTASFTIEQLPAINTWLHTHDLDEDGECLLRRVITANSKSRASINGRPVSAQMLRELGSQLVAIHGQHEHQALAQPGAQRQLLDRYANSALPQQVAEAHAAWQQAESRYHEHNASLQARQQRLDLLHFQVQEFDALDISGAAVADIEAEHNWLANAEKLKALGSETLAALDDDGGANTSLNLARQPLAELVQIDERLREALDLIESAAIQSAEAASLLRNHSSAMEHDESRLAWLDERLARLHGLARKHQVDMGELAQLEQSLRDELDDLVQPPQQASELLQERDDLQQAYIAKAGKQTSLRKRMAKKLAAVISQSMQALGMTDGVFRIDIKTDKEQLHRHGQDAISFMVSPNPGVEPAPLARIASGGELSRISLCVQLATIESHAVPTLIFDEVDAGIGGAIAETVGQLLRRVGQHAQVLCVTHLPQVAAQAHQHVKVSKSVHKGQTSTQLDTLDLATTRDEIARMLGGVKITRKSRQHAREMLDGVVD